MLDLAHQSIDQEQSAYETALGDALEAILTKGTHDLDGIVAGLNESDIRPPEGGEWTAEIFQREMAQLGQ